MKKWIGSIPGNRTIAFESDDPHAYMQDAGYSAYALEQITYFKYACPVDRERVIIGLDPLKDYDALAYIYYLEERLNAKERIAK